MNGGGRVGANSESCSLSLCVPCVLVSVSFVSQRISVSGQ